VVVAGRVVVRDHRLVTADERENAARLRELLAARGAPQRVGHRKVGGADTTAVNDV
jgi:hypothetical protein